MVKVNYTAKLQTVWDVDCQSVTYINGTVIVVPLQKCSLCSLYKGKLFSAVQGKFFLPIWNQFNINWWNHEKILSPIWIPLVEYTMWRSGLSHKKPASILEVMGFLFFRFLNNRGRERDRSARILSLSSLQPMVSWRGIAESWKGKNPDYCAFPEIRNILESLVSRMKPGKRVPY